QPSDPLSPARLGVALAKGGRRAQRRARRRRGNQSAGGYPLHGLPLSGASGSVSRARNRGQGRRTKAARLPQEGGRAAGVVRGAPKIDAAMPAKTRVVVVVAAATVAVLAGVVSWQWLAGGNAPWARFLGTDAVPLAFVGSDTCAQCHSAEAKLWRASQHKQAMDHASVLGDFNEAGFDYYGVRSPFFRQGGKFFVETAGHDRKAAPL